MRSDRVILIVKLVLLAFLVWTIAGLIYRGSTEQEPPVASRVEVPKTQIELPGRQPLPADYKEILERDLFRLSKADPTAVDDEAIMSTKRPGTTGLQFRLLGTITGSEKLARAVIEDIESNVQGVYATGESIQGARIEKIERNRIVLLGRDGQEVLDLHVAMRDTASPEGEVKSVVAEDQSGSEVVKVVSPTEREIDRKAFASKVGRMDAVLKSVKFSPHVVDGKAEGLRITDLEGLNVASYIGLRNGDIVQGLNGQTITNRRKAFQVLRRAQTLPSSDIEFLRGSEKKTLSLKMR